jgi:hypothetical protein
MAMTTALIIPLSAHAQTTSSLSDYTDIWWNPDTSGWGVNMVQSDQFIFATFFVYDVDGNPCWYVAEMDYQNNIFSGKIIKTKSAPTRDIWTPVNVQRTVVGNAVFTPESSTKGTITLTFDDGVVLTKQVERQTLKAPTIQEEESAVYQATIKTKYEEENRGNDRVWYSTHTSTMRFTKNGNQGTLSFTNNDGVDCQITGPLEVKGRKYEIDDDFGRYTCSNGYSAKGELDLQFTSSGGMVGSWETEYRNYEEEAHFTAIKQ